MVKNFKLVLFSGGNISIDYSKCRDCESKACTKFCQSSTLEPVLKIENGIPVTTDSSKIEKKNWCTECLACELNCGLYGKGAIRIELPLGE
ncbi:MAG: hypothetical protein KJ995_04155 [Candidatus Omnitrophica bacterium]|nr:hypothetical protein [Candidatus Omnitrophota bacterium]MBU1128575.1 hypothetical protein [Candidatus Omnitrophota bacterium]MBU1657243.1 hypothetical protein [Candidatus Omnitrophota bacterium]MBU1784788.1 hypothetical protein [Candidatus Omnitrophota bacterium]MBU1851579.1 hypothetical protein [Candidatus Omnitrophota bacterium]